MSLYADAKNDAALLDLDDALGTLKTALQNTSKISFLTYGIGKDNLSGLKWNLLNEEGWGILINKDE